MGFFRLLIRGRKRPKPFLPYTSLSAFSFWIGVILVALFSLFYTSETGTKEWPSAEGVVWTSKVAPQGGATALQFEYRFNVRGTTHRSAIISKGQSPFLPEWLQESPDPQEVVAKYPERARVTVYYDPGNPRNSVLEPGVTRLSLLGLAAGILLILLGAWLFFKRPFREIDKQEEYETDIWLPR